MICWRIKKIHSALNLAAYFRQKASEKPAGFYRINELEEARKALERARVLRLNAVFPDCLILLTYGDLTVEEVDTCQ